MRGRFVVGYDNNDGDYDVNDTGGSKNITLSTSNLPSHTHGAGSYTAGSAGSHNHTYEFHNTNNSIDDDEYPNGAIRPNIQTGTTSSAGAHTHSVTGTSGSTGSGSSFDNRPPYYALCYIMKA